MSIENRLKKIEGKMEESNIQITLPIVVVATSKEEGKSKIKLEQDSIKKRGLKSIYPAMLIIIAQKID